MGIVFGGLGNTNNENYIYSVGYVNLDTTSSENPYLNITYICDTIDKMDDFTMKKIESNSSASKQLENKEIDAYIIFPDEFHLYINGTVPKLNETIEIFYRDSTSAVSRTIISSTLLGVIDGVVNYNPNAIKIEYIERTISGEQISPLTLGTPGYLLYGILSSMTGGIILLTSERKDGLLKRLESSQITPGDILMGNMISNTSIIILQFLIGVGMLSLFGFRPNFHDIVSLFFGTLITILLLAFFQNALIFISSSILKTPEAAGGGIWLLLIPMMMFSGAFFPLELVTPGLIPYVGWIPTRLVVLLFQDLMINGLAFWHPSILLKFLWLSLEGLALFLLAVIMYRKFAQSSG